LCQLSGVDFLWAKKTSTTNICSYQLKLNSSKTFIYFVKEAKRGKEGIGWGIYTAESLQSKNFHEFMPTHLKAKAKRQEKRQKLIQSLGGGTFINKTFLSTFKSWTH
jgi:hypothetical protein